MWSVNSTKYLISVWSHDFMMSNVCSKNLEFVRVVTRNNYKFLVLENEFLVLFEKPQNTHQLDQRKFFLLIFCVFFFEKISLMMFNYQEPTQAKRFQKKKLRFFIVLRFFLILTLDKQRMKKLKEAKRRTKNKELSSLIFAHPTHLFRIFLVLLKQPRSQGGTNQILSFQLVECLTAIDSKRRKRVSSHSSVQLSWSWNHFLTQGKRRLFWFSNSSRRREKNCQLSIGNYRKGDLRLVSPLDMSSTSIVNANISHTMKSLAISSAFNNIIFIKLFIC